MKPASFDQQIETGGGLDTRLLDALVESARCVGVMNYEFSTYPRMAVTRAGYASWGSVGGTGVFYLLDKTYIGASSGTDYQLCQMGNDLFRALSTSPTFAQVASGLAGAYPDLARFDDATYLVNGVDNLRSSNGASWFAIGNAAPTGAPTLSAFGTGSTTGSYYAAFAYRYGPFGMGPIGPITTTPVTLSNQRVRVLNLTNGPTGVTSKVIYLSAPSSPGTVYLLGSTGNNTATTWSSPAFTNEDLLDSAPEGLATIPISRLIEWHGGRMYYCPVSDRSVIFPSMPVMANEDSVPTGPDVYDADYVIYDIRDADGSRVTAMASLGEILLIFTETAVWALYGANPSGQKLSRIYNEGCPEGGHRAVKVIGGKCYWKSRTHVYRTNGYPEGTIPVSLDIERTLLSLDVTASAISEWFAVDYRRRGWYMLFAASTDGLVGSLSSTTAVDGSTGPPGATVGGVGTWNNISALATGRLCLVYDYRQGELENRHVWTVFSIDSTAGYSNNGGAGDQLVYFASPGTALLRQFERSDAANNDVSTPVNAKIRFAWRNSGLWANDKRLRRFYTHAQAFGGTGTGYHGVAVDLGRSVFVESLSWSTIGNIQRGLLPMEATSEHMQAYCGWSTAGVRLLLEAYGFQLKPYNQR